MRGSHVPRAAAGPFNLKVDPIFGVNEARGIALHGLVRHGPQINQKPELVPCVKLCQIHVFRFVCWFGEEGVNLLPDVFGADFLVVNPVWRAVDCDADFHQVRVAELF